MYVYMPSHINVHTHIYRRIQIYLWFCTDTQICTHKHIISGLLTHKYTQRCAYMHRCTKYVHNLELSQVWTRNQWQSANCYWSTMFKRFAADCISTHCFL